jgi:hypothetical protein
MALQYPSYYSHTLTTAIIVHTVLLTSPAHTADMIAHTAHMIANTAGIIAYTADMTAIIAYIANKHVQDADKLAHNLTLIEPGPGRTVKYQVPLSFFYVTFTMSKLTSPGICIVCNRGLLLQEFALNGEAPAVQLKRARGPA